MNSVKTKELQLEQLMPLWKERLEAGQSVRFSPKGISMLPLLRQGTDSVLLSPPTARLKKYDIVLKLIMYIQGFDIFLTLINKGDVFNETDIPAQ